MFLDLSLTRTDEVRETTLDYLPQQRVNTAPPTCQFIVSLKK